MRPWTRLDNTAKLFPSVRSDRITHLFRLAVRLSAPVDPDRLAGALASIWPRFPSFQMQLRPGFFWYSLVEWKAVPPVYPETPSPCQPFHRRFQTPHLVRVRWFGRRLAVEFSHALTDGVGGLRFLQALVAEYLVQGGVAEADPEDLRRARSAPDPDEGRDDYQKLYDRAYPRLEPWNQAFQPPARLLPKGTYAVTTGRLPLGPTLARAKALGTTLTGFLSACFLAALQEVFWAQAPAQRRARPLRLVVPVNLRPVFGSKTLRNFFSVVPIEIDLRLGAYEFAEIVRRVHHQLQVAVDPKLLKKQVMRNLRGELNPVTRLIPLPLKNLILSGVYGSFERQHTASLSNLGRVDGPASWSGEVLDFEFTPPPSPLCPVNAGVVSFGDTLSVTLGSLATAPDVEWAFFTLLRRQGLAVALESNRPFSEV